VPGAPAGVALTRVTAPVPRSQTCTSRLAATSFDTTNATIPPFAEIEGAVLPPEACGPVGLTRTVVLLVRSRTKMSLTPFVSPATRLEADDANET